MKFLLLLLLLITLSHSETPKEFDPNIVDFLKNLTISEPEDPCYSKAQQVRTCLAGLETFYQSAELTYTTWPTFESVMDMSGRLKKSIECIGDVSSCGGGRGKLVMAKYFTQAILYALQRTLEWSYDCLTRTIRKDAIISNCMIEHITPEIASSSPVLPNIVRTALPNIVKCVSLNISGEYCMGHHVRQVYRGGMTIVDLLHIMLDYYENEDQTEFLTNFSKTFNATDLDKINVE